MCNGMRKQGWLVGNAERNGSDVGRRELCVW